MANSSGVYEVSLLGSLIDGPPYRVDCQPSFPPSLFVVCQLVLVALDRVRDCMVEITVTSKVLVSTCNPEAQLVVQARTELLVVSQSS